jgi:hypothetical protein
VLEVLPRCSDAWYQKGYSHYHLQQFAEAVRLLTLLPVRSFLGRHVWAHSMRHAGMNLHMDLHVRVGQDRTRIALACRRAASRKAWH